MLWGTHYLRKPPFPAAVSGPCHNLLEITLAIRTSEQLGSDAPLPDLEIETEESVLWGISGWNMMELD